MQDIQTNTFVKGMNLDTAKEFVDSGQYIYATDVHISSGAQSTNAALSAYLQVHKYDEFESLNGHDVLGSIVGKIYHENKQKECLIVFTRYNNTNHLCVYTGLDKFDTVQLTFKLDYDFGISSNVKLINVYESELISRVYIAAQNKEIQVVNINNLDSDAYSEKNDFSIFPRCGVLRPFEFDREISGNLTAGKSQYAYQLFNRNGQVTAVSVISKIIPHGSALPGENSLTGVKLKLNFDSKIIENFDHIRIYAIRYTNGTDMPTIHIKSEVEIQNNFEFHDTDDFSLSTITLEEFNAIKRQPFLANTIETKDNILFAAGIQYVDWDVEFDARAYPANDKGEVKISSKTSDPLTINQNEPEKLSKIPDTFDCIVDYDNYKYISKYGRCDYGWIENSNSNQFLYGGAGVNVEYAFEHPLLYLAPFSADDYKPMTKWGSDCGPLLTEELTENKYVEEKTQMDVYYQHIHVNGMWTDFDKTTPQSSYNLSQVNYADPWVCANYTGFKQGEIYAFGIVFYNDHGIASPVHWIGDIKIPTLHQWIYGGVIHNDNTKYHDLIAAATGITFRVNISSIKSQITGFEIVRCNRTPADRTVLCQGILTPTLFYSEEHSRPFSFPSIHKRHGVSIGDYSEVRYSNAVLFGDNSKRLCTFTSPEISIYKDTIQPYLKDVKSFNVNTNLFGYMCHDSELTKNPSDSYQTYLFFKRLKYATRPDRFKKPDGEYNTSRQDYCGVFITTSDPEYANNYHNRFCFSLGMGKTDATSIEYALFKFYQAAQYGYENLECDIDNVVYSTAYGWEVTPQSATQNGVLIDDNNYVNFCSISSENEEHKNRQSGAHGYCLVFDVQDETLKTLCGYTGGGSTYPNNYKKMEIPLYWKLATVLNTHTSHAVTYEAYRFYDESSKEDLKEHMYGSLDGKSIDLSALQNTIVLVDILTDNVPYGGDTYSARINRTYTSTGQYCECSGSDVKNVIYKSCYGGDTYIGIHSELWSQYYASADDVDGQGSKLICHVKYPVETSINLGRVSGPNYSTSPEEVVAFFEPSTVAAYSQDKPLNAYNDSYSAREFNKLFAQRDVWDIYNQYVPNRIIASDVKSIGELTDSYQSFKVANYIDVDNRYGNITNLINFDGKLFFFQEHAFGYVTVNERSLINDNQAQLLLGTGGVLTALQYYSQYFGTNVLNDPSIVTTPGGMYWYDQNKKTIEQFSKDGVNPLSLLKSVQTYVNNSKATVVYSAYDVRNREVWFRFNTDNNSLIFNEVLSQFTGFYSKAIQFSTTLSDRTVSFIGDENSLICIGVLDDEHTPMDIKPSVKFVVNKNPMTSKVFDAIAIADITKDDTTMLCNYVFKTNCQTSEITDDNNNTKLVEGLYYTHIPRDTYKGRMRDRCLTVEMSFKQNDFNISGVSTIFRQSLH